MHRVNRYRRTHDTISRAVIVAFRFRRWIPEVVIVVMMLSLLLVELSLQFTSRPQTLIHVVIWSLLFGLITLWVYINRAALAAWEQDGAEEPGA